MALLQPTGKAAHLEEAENMARAILNAPDLSMQNEMIALFLKTIIDERCAVLRKIEQELSQHKEALNALGDIKRHIGMEIWGEEIPVR